MTLAIAFAAALPPETIREKAKDVLGRPEFAIDGAVDPDAARKLVEMLGFFRRLLFAFLEMLDSLPAPIKWLVLGFLVISLVGILSHLGYTLWVLVFGVRRKLTLAMDEDKKVVPEDLETAAIAAQANGDWIGAVRIFFQASLVRLEQKEGRSYRRGVTNREILRKYRTTEAYKPLEWFVQTIDQKWYGLEPCNETDCEAGARQHRAICDLVGRRPHVVSA